MMNSKLKFRINYKKLALTLVAILFLSFVVNFNQNKEFISKTFLKGLSISPIKSVSAQEIYSLFKCPCCDKPIGECTCPMANERQAFVDGLVIVEVSEDQAVSAYVKKFGLSSFIDEDKEEKFKQKLIEEAPEDRPIIAISPDFYNFVDVSQKQGVVSALFEIKNEGKNDLVIERLETSCGCTSASIVYQDKESPKFSMPGHGDDEETKDWQLSIPSGEKAQLKVYYDPNVHQDFRGPVTRTVSIFSNDSVNFEKEIIIELNQVD